MDNLFFNKKEILQKNGYSFFEADCDLTSDDFFELDLYPKAIFQNRKSQNFLGLGKVHFENIFEIAALLPPEFSYFVQRDFSGEETLCYFPQVLLFNNKIYGVEKTGELLSFKKQKSPHSSFQIKNRTDSPQKQNWHLLFHKIYQNFNNETFKKIVPARCVSFNIEGTINHYETYKKVCHTANYNFYFASSPSEVFLGSSPERLLSFENQTLFTEAVAGTRTKDRAKELLTSHKDLYEHRLVVEDIVAKIKPFVSEFQADIQPQLIESKNLAHLKTYIEAKPKNGFTDVFAVLNSLHPTSAVCGMPKLAAQNFLKENESFPREKYAGFFGIANKNSAEICVTLRSCKIKDSKLYLYSGVGVVPDSDPDQEWQELDHKIQPYLDLFL